MAKTRKKKAAMKPAYTRLKGYQHIADVVRRVPKFLSDAAQIVVRFSLANKEKMTAGEVLASNDAIKLIASHAQGVKDKFESIKERFNVIIESPGQRVEEDFIELVFESMDFINEVSEFVIKPVIDLTEIIERIGEIKETEHVE